MSLCTNFSTHLIAIKMSTELRSTTLLSLPIGTSATRRFYPSMTWQRTRPTAQLEPMRTEFWKIALTLEMSECTTKSRIHRVKKSEF